jgi:hypothetical protein
MLQKYGFAIFSRKLLSRHYKMKSLGRLVKFRQLAVKLFQKDQSGVSQRWKRLVKRLAAEGEIKINPFRNISAMIK